MDEFTVTGPYTGFLADRTYIQMRLLNEDEKDKVLLERLGRYVQYMDYLYNKTHSKQSITNSEFKLKK